MNEVLTLHGGWRVTMGKDSNGFHVVVVVTPEGKTFEIDRPDHAKIAEFPKFVRKCLNEKFGVR